MCEPGVERVDLSKSVTRIPIIKLVIHNTITNKAKTQMIIERQKEGVGLESLGYEIMSF